MCRQSIIADTAAPCSWVTQKPISLSPAFLSIDHSCLFYLFFFARLLKERILTLLPRSRLQASLRLLSRLRRWSSYGHSLSNHKQQPTPPSRKCSKCNLSGGDKRCWLLERRDSLTSCHASHVGLDGHLLDSLSSSSGRQVLSNIFAIDTSLFLFEVQI